MIDLSSPLSNIPTKDLLDEFMSRAEKGEVMAPILHWIANMAALDLIKRHGHHPVAETKQWLLNAVVRALTHPEYDEWVSKYEASGKKWELGVAPEGEE